MNASFYWLASPLTRLGRYDLGVSVDTIDLEMPRNLPGLDAAEFQVARHFAQFLRVIKNVQASTLMYGKLRKKTSDWALDPNFVGHNADFPIWLRELPEDMQIVYPQDGSPPWIPSHYVANMHCYHYLSVIMHFRPQLHAVSDSYDGIWKQHMISCYTAAKNLCRLQEAILKTYGLHGLLCMLRGISFTIYSILTCTMLHLVSGLRVKRLMAPSNIDIGCHHLPGPRAQQRCAGILCAPHAHPGDMHSLVAHAGDAPAGQQPSPGLLRRCHQAI